MLERFGSDYANLMEYFDTEHFIGCLGRYADLKGKNVLDVGCGPGQLTSVLANRCSALMGVDPNPQYIARATWRAGCTGRVDLQIACAEDLPFPDRSYDAVFCSWVLHECEDLEAALSEVIRVLRPTGYAVIVEPVKASDWGILDLRLRGKLDLPIQFHHELFFADMFGVLHALGCNWVHRLIRPRFLFPNCDIAARSLLPNMHLPVKNTGNVSAMLQDQIRSQCSENGAVTLHDDALLVCVHPETQ